jgi:membrane protein YdbS with pleckstrin-like domain
MEDKNTTTVNCGISFSGLLFLVFLVLKLVGVIEWSWWWITAPLWIPVALVVVIFVACFIVLSIKELIDTRRIKKNRGK